MQNTKDPNAPRDADAHSHMIRTYKIDEAQTHELSLGLTDFLAPRAWAGPFFMTLMIAGFVLALVYGLMAAGGKINLGRETWGTAEKAFIIAAGVVYLLIWMALTVRRHIKRAKEELVIKERGKALWTLIDEKKWDSFVKLTQLKQRKETLDEYNERQQDAAAEDAEKKGKMLS
ncbi:MAG: hypothetical protein GY754_18320 [bacterium]|nr:hypothetical protein [bacterium]